MSEFKLRDKVWWFDADNLYEKVHGEIAAIVGDCAVVAERPEDGVEVRHTVWMSNLFHDSPQIIAPVPAEQDKKGWQPDGFDQDAFRRFMREL